jgi:hypothetical protein
VAHSSQSECAQAEVENKGKEENENKSKTNENDDDNDDYTRREGADEEEAGAGGMLRTSGADADNTEREKMEKMTMKEVRHEIQGNSCTPKTGHKAKSNKRAPEQAPALGAEHYPANIWARWW